MNISVKAARVNAGLTQREAADALKLSLHGYQKKESGRSRFYVDEIIALSRLFGVPYENFFEVSCLLKTQNSA